MNNYQNTRSHIITY